jgi:hypothetical protein
MIPTFVPSNTRLPGIGVARMSAGATMGLPGAFTLLISVMVVAWFAAMDCTLSRARTT